MFRNWVEVRQFMIDRQSELLREAENSRKRRLAGKKVKPGSSASTSAPWPGCELSPDFPGPDLQP